MKPYKVGESVYYHGEKFRVAVKCTYEYCGLKSGFKKSTYYILDGKDSKGKYTEHFLDETDVKFFRRKAS